MKSSLPECAQAPCRKQDCVLRIPAVLILLCAFFLPWGPGLQSIIYVNASKAFAVMVSLLVLYWLLCVRHKFSAMPSAITLFLLYLVLHTLVTYTLFFPERLGSGYASEIYGRREQILLSAPWQAGFGRMMLFAAFAYAVAACLKTDRQLQAVALSMGLGLLVTLLIGRGNLHISGPDTRIAAGFENPNYFASVAVTVFFVNLAVWVKVGNRLWIRVLSGCFILTSLTGCLVSGSRGAQFGLAAGLITVLASGPWTLRRIREVAGLLLLVMLAVVFVPSEIFETVRTRLSIDRLLEDRLAGRLDIWIAYLTRLPQYFFAGAGYGRSSELVRGEALLRYSTHNQYLLVLVEQGIAGLLLFVVGLCQVWKRLRHPAKHLENWKRDAIYRGFFVAWLFLLLVGTRTTSRSWWFSLGIIVAHAQQMRSEVNREH